MSGKPSSPPKIGYIFSTELGLRTHYKNWRDSVETLLSPEEAIWIVIDWYKSGGRIERLPVLTSSQKAWLRSHQQLLDGLRKGPYRYLFIGAPMVSYLHQRRFAQTPYFTTLDSTPSLLYSFGRYYHRAPHPIAAIEAFKERQRRRFYREARCHFPWSQWVADSLGNDYLVDAARLNVVPPGVDLTLWRFPERHLTETVHLLFVGSDFHRKGGDLLLEWAKQTPLQNWHLHLVTRDPVAISHPRVHVYNHLSSNDPELIALYQQAHAFVLPTRADCYSLAGIEAMASGLPVLLGDTGGTREIIRPGETGYLLKAGNRDDLTDHLETLLRHPERLLLMGQAARHDAEERFDARKNIQKIRGLIEQALAS